MRHDHDDTRRLTFGCPACIRKVKRNELVADTAEALLNGDYELGGDPFDWLLVDPHFEKTLYRHMRSSGLGRRETRWRINEWWEECAT